MTKLFFLTLTLILAALYAPSFTSVFFQDDKILFFLSQKGALWLPIANFPYRPISQQLLYLGLWKIFGYQVLPYHLLLFLFTLGSIFLVFKIGQTILKNSRPAALTALFYALNISLFPHYFWVATSYSLLGAFFSFLTILSFLQKRYGLLYVAFFLALGSNEISFVLPALLILVAWYERRFSPHLIFITLIDLLALTLRILLVGFPKYGDYSLIFNLSTLSTLRWYLLRALNLPEGIRFSSEPLILFAFLTFVLVLLVSLRRFKLRLFSLCAGIFILGALPFYFLPGHMSSYYLSLSLLGSSLFAAHLLAKSQWLMLFALCLYLLLAALGLNFLSSTHWIILKNTGPIGAFTSL